MNQEQDQNQVMEGASSNLEQIEKESHRRALYIKWIKRQLSSDQPLEQLPPHLDPNQ